MSNYSLFGEFQIVEPNLVKRKNDNSFEKRHCINTMIIVA